MKKKDKYANTPKWAKHKGKVARHTARIRMAKIWFASYKGSGKHIVHAYREKFKVDTTTALNDLGEIGALTPEQLQAKRQAEEVRLQQLRAQKEEKALQDFYDRFPDSNDQFFYIAGYTPGGAPYGVTWDEMGLLPYQSLEDIDYMEPENNAMDLLDELRIRRKNAICIDIGCESEGPHETGATKFGGMPDVPGNFIWPVFETETFDDEQAKPRPLAFLVQFNCADFARLDKDKLLPRTGVLSFFYELGSQRWGFDPQDKGCAKVFWFEDMENLTPAPFPDALDEDYRMPEISISMCKEKRASFKLS